MFFVYVIKSLKDARLYVGMTSDVERRLSEHNKGMTTSTRFYRPWELCRVETFPDRLSAREREKYLKSGHGKTYLRRLYNNKLVP